MKKLLHTKNTGLITAVIVGIGLIGSISVVNALARPGIAVLEKPLIQDQPSLLTNTAFQTAPQVPERPLAPPEKPKPTDSIRPLEPISPSIDKNPDCYTPDPANPPITENTQLCPGQYNMPNPAPGSFKAFITIGASDITLDCNGARLYSNYNYPPMSDPGRDGYSYGIFFNDDFNNVVLKNCILDKFYVGLSVADFNNWEPFNNITIENFSFNQGCEWYTYINNLHDSEIIGNTKPQGSDHRGWATFWLLESEDNIIHDNDLFGHAGIRIYTNSHNNEISNNSIGHIPATAWEKVGLSLDRNATLNNVYDNEFLDIENDGTAIGMWGGTVSPYVAAYYNEIYNNTFTDVYFGIKMNHDVAYNNFHDNIFDNVEWNGVIMYPFFVGGTWYYPHNNTFENNTFTNTFRCLVLGKGVHNNNFYSTTCSNSTDTAVYLYQGTGSTTLAQNNTFENNLLSGSQTHGVFFESNTATNNNFINNKIKNTVDRGLYVLSGNTNNTFSGNHFVDNNTNVYDLSAGNIYDFNQVGNYYDNHDDPATGCDDEDFNGVCDDLYIIPGSGNSTDAFPISGVPILNPITPNPIVINEMYWAIISPDAWDPNGDELTYSVDNANFGSMEACWPGSNAFGWGTNQYSAGTYTVNVTVSDGEHDAMQSVDIVVHNTCRLGKWGTWTCNINANYHPACY